MRIALLSLIIALLSTPVFGAEPEAITPQAAWEQVQKKGDQILFVDVRDPIEIMFVGFTDAVDLNVPFKLADRQVFIEDKKHFAMQPNPDFASAIEQALTRKGLDKSALVITLCRSGSDRGKPSAAFLVEHGFSNVKYVENGFQGDKASEGDQAGMRTVNGWMNSGLPWSWELNPQKIHRP